MCGEVVDPRSILEWGVTMFEVRIPIGDNRILTSGRSGPELERDMRFLLAAKLFELGRVSLAQAADRCSMSRIRFMDELGHLHIPVINLEDDQLQDELRDA